MWEGLRKYLISCGVLKRMELSLFLNNVYKIFYERKIS